MRAVVVHHVQRAVGVHRAFGSFRFANRVRRPASTSSHGGHAARNGIATGVYRNGFAILADHIRARHGCQVEVYGVAPLTAAAPAKRAVVGSVMGGDASDSDGGGDDGSSSDENDF